MKRKGFTLIELLAVIIILAIIALIATPMIMGIIKEARKEAFKDSVYGAFRQLEYYVLDNEKSLIEGVDVTAIGLKKGNFKSGTFKKNAQGKIEVINITDGRYCASGVMDNLEVVEGACDIKTPDVEATITYTTSNHEWTYQDVNVTITYSDGGVKLLKTTVPVTSNVNAIKCESVNNGSYTCNGETTKNLEGESWYIVEGNPILTFDQNGSVIAQIIDKNEYKVASSFAVANIDKTEPIVAKNGPGPLLYVPGYGSNGFIAMAFCEDTESGIAKYEFSKDNGTTWINNGTKDTYKFMGLQQDTNYNVKARCTNGAGLSIEEGKVITTKTLNTPKISLVAGRSYPYGTANAMLETQITYDNSSTMNLPVNYFKSSVTATVTSGVVVASCGTGNQPGECTSSNVTTLVADTWYQTNSTSPKITYYENGILYALMSDGTNLSGTSTLSVNNIGDTTAPTVVKSGPNSGLIWSPVTLSDSIYVMTFCEDTESGIAKYEFSKDNGITWINNGKSSSYTFGDLPPGTSYAVKARCTNGAGLSIEEGINWATATLSTPAITQISQASGSATWAYRRTIQITYNRTFANDPYYYFKSTVSAEVESGVVTRACGTGTNPGTCSNSNVTTLVAGTWYRTPNPKPSITYTTNGELYAVLGDGTNFSEKSSYMITYTDSTAPTVNLNVYELRSGMLTFGVTCSDPESGISSYKINDPTVLGRDLPIQGYAFPGIGSGTYSIYGCCTNGAGLGNCTASQTVTVP